MAAILLATQPSPFWYASRSAGTISLLLLTVVMVLGLATSARLTLASRWRFVLQGAHRNLSLLTLAFLAVHITASVLDPYAGISWRDALIPFIGSYRPFWLGLGVLALELLVALIVSALLSRWIGRRVFRAVHWAAYACWPIALLHGLGTGTDVRSGWFYILSVTCVGAAVAGLVGWRLLRGGDQNRRTRAAAGLATLLGLVLLGAWAFGGPLRPGWALAAGTPPNLVHSTAGQVAPPPPAALLPANLDELMTGHVSTSSAGYTIALSSSAQPVVTVEIDMISSQAVTGTVVVSRSGNRICGVTTSPLNPIAGSCGSTPFHIAYQVRGSGQVVARLTTGVAATSSTEAI